MLPMIAGSGRLICALTAINAWLSLAPDALIPTSVGSSLVLRLSFVTLLCFSSLLAYHLPELNAGKSIQRLLPWLFMLPSSLSFGAASTLYVTFLALAAAGAAYICCLCFTRMFRLELGSMALCYAVASLCSLGLAALVRSYVPAGPLRIIAVQCLPLAALSALSPEPEFCAPSKGTPPPCSSALYLFAFCLTVQCAGGFTVEQDAFFPSWLWSALYSVVLFVQASVTFSDEKVLSPVRLLYAVIVLCASGIVLQSALPRIGDGAVLVGTALFELTFLILTSKKATSPRLCRYWASIAVATMFTGSLAAEVLRFLAGWLVSSSSEQVALLSLVLASFFGLYILLPTRGTPSAESQLSQAEEDDGLRGQREVRTQMILAPFALTPQENRICLMLLNSLKDDDICRQLFITQNTLKYHLRNLYRKLGISGRRDLPDFMGRMDASLPKVSSTHSEPSL